MPSPSSESSSSEDDGGCFISTACIRAKGLPDDCFELQLLRWFRDTYLMQTTDRREGVKYYYRVAPKITAAIDRSPHADVVYDDLYDRLVCPSINAVLAGEMGQAYQLYEQILRELEQKFLA